MKSLGKKSYTTGNSRCFPLAVLVFVSLQLTQCLEIPGCGPGEIPRNPINSNLVDYTIPPSGDILRPSEFDSFEIHFLTQMDTDTFDISDDIGICWMVSDETECDPDVANSINPATVFTSSSWNCDSEGNACLELGVNSGPLDPLAALGRRYMIRMRKNGVSSSLASSGGTQLADDVDIYVKVVKNTAERTMPHVAWVTPYPYFAEYYAPHELIEFKFTDIMGYINIVSDPLWGLNFRAVPGKLIVDGNPADVTFLQTDSIQGLTPGETYNIGFLSEDAAPEKVPYTMDIHGNPLTIAYGDKPTTFIPLPIKVAHVRIINPLHTPFSDEPDRWDFTSRPKFTLQYTNDVARLSCRNEEYDLNHGDPTVVFSELTDLAGSTSILVDTARIHQNGEWVPDLWPEVIETHDLVVHAYDHNDEYLGYDRLEVYARPYPKYSCQPVTIPSTDDSLPTALMIAYDHDTGEFYEISDQPVTFDLESRFSLLGIVQDEEGVSYADIGAEAVYVCEWPAPDYRYRDIVNISYPQIAYHDDSEVGEEAVTCASLKRPFIGSYYDYAETLEIAIASCSGKDGRVVYIGAEFFVYGENFHGGQASTSLYSFEYRP